MTLRGALLWAAVLCFALALIDSFGYGLPGSTLQWVAGGLLAGALARTP